MNGIVHNCTHPEWNDNYLNRLSEKEMTFGIFQYIDKLIQTIKPRKLIYMAIDGNSVPPTLKIETLIGMIVLQVVHLEPR